MNSSNHDHYHAPNRFAVIPTPVRLSANEEYTGKGVTLAFLDSGFYPHPDLLLPRNRIVAYHDVAGERLSLLSDGPGEPWQWHGTQTAVTAAGITTATNAQSTRWTSRMLDALRKHWPEYLMEAAELGLFMFSACAFTVLLYHPASPVAQTIHDGVLRRLTMGMAMGSTAVAIIFSTLGKRSGAHFNPAVTWTFFRLGKIDAWDAAFYTLFQFAGGIAGVILASLALGRLIAHQAVNYAVTLPGPDGPIVACFAEFFISFILMLAVLTIGNTKRFARWTGIFAGALVAAYIIIESPLSGMSMNPARTFSSAVGAHSWMSLWIYFVAPPLGMLAAAEVYRLLNAHRPIHCAKLHHHNNQRCIFRCNFEPNH